MIFRNFMTLMQEDVPKLALAFPDIPYAEVEPSWSRVEGAWRCRGTAKGTSAFCVSQPRQSRICLRQPHDKHQKVAATWDLKTSPSSLFPFSSSSSLSPTTRLFPLLWLQHPCFSVQSSAHRPEPLPTDPWSSVFVYILLCDATKGDTILANSDMHL